MSEPAEEQRHVARWLPGLLNRDALREVPRLIHVRSLQHGDVIGEQLNRNGVEQRGDERIDRRQLDGGRSDVAEPLDAGGIGQEDHLAAAAMTSCMFEAVLSNSESKAR